MAEVRAGRDHRATWTASTPACSAMNRLGDPQTSPLAQAAHDRLRADLVGQPVGWSTRGMAARRDGLIGLVQGGDPAPHASRSAHQRRPAGRRRRAERRAAAMGPIGTRIRRRGADGRARGQGRVADARLPGRLSQAAHAPQPASRTRATPGPGAKQFMQQTLDGSGSELADALKYVDEQMLTGMSDSAEAWRCGRSWCAR